MNRISTALICLFTRAYHYKNNAIRIFSDSIAEKIITDNEFSCICENMSKGITFFNSSFNGNDNEALRWIVDNQLSPSPLGRQAYCEKMLENAVLTGTYQYIILACGYDTFAYRQPEWTKKIHIFEIDKSSILYDKQSRLKQANIKEVDNNTYIKSDLLKSDWYKDIINTQKFNKGRRSFCSILGLLYYLPIQKVEELIYNLSMILTKGSTIVFDYPDDNSYFGTNAGERSKKQYMMATATGEKMISKFSYREIEILLHKYGFLIYEHLSPDQITYEYFYEYNIANPKHLITAFDNVNYCLAVKNQ